MGGSSCESCPLTGAIAKRAVDLFTIVRPADGAGLDDSLKSLDRPDHATPGLRQG